MQGTAQRFALLAGGWAWKISGRRTNSKPEKCLKIRTLPTRPVHALLDERFGRVSASSTTNSTTAACYRDCVFDYSPKPSNSHILLQRLSPKKQPLEIRKKGKDRGGRLKPPNRRSRPIEASRRVVKQRQISTSGILPAKKPERDASRAKAQTHGQATSVPCRRTCRGAGQCLTP